MVLTGESWAQCLREYVSASINAQKTFDNAEITTIPLHALQAFKNSAIGLLS